MRKRSGHDVLRGKIPGLSDGGAGATQETKQCAVLLQDHNALMNVLAKDVRAQNCEIR
jgi:hypothetical protein